MMNLLSNNKNFMSEINKPKRIALSTWNDNFTQTYYKQSYLCWDKKREKKSTITSALKWKHSINLSTNRK